MNQSIIKTRPSFLKAMVNPVSLHHKSNHILPYLNKSAFQITAN